MSDWIALLGDRHPHCGVAGSVPLRAGALVLELAGLPAAPAVLLGCHRMGQASAGTGTMRDGWGEAMALDFGLSLTAGRAEGITLRHRSGPNVVRHELSCPLPATAGRLVVVLSWAGAGHQLPAGRWQLSLQRPDGTPLVPAAAGQGALALHPGDAWLVCQPGRHRITHEMVVRAGVRRGRCLAADPPETLGGRVVVSANAAVAVEGGVRPVGLLRPGDQVIDIEGAPVRLAANHIAEVPIGMAFAPIRLRAGHFPISKDVVAGPGALIAVQGDEVEYRIGVPLGALPARLVPAPLAQQIGAPLRSLLMALPVPERPAILRLGGLDFVLAGPDRQLPAGCRVFHPAEAADLLGRTTGPASHVFGSSA